MEGTPITVSAIGTDPTGVSTTFDLLFEVLLGQSVVTSDNTTSPGEFSFTPADNGDYLVRVTATGDNLSMGVASQLLSVANVAPSFDAGADEMLPPAGAGVFTRTIDFTDPGEDTWFGTVNYGDGSPVQPLEIDAANRRFTLNHVYSTPGTYTVSVVLSDDDMGSQTDTFNVVLNSTNAAPTAIALSANSIAENVAAGSTVGTLSTTDPGAGGTFTYSLVVGTGDTDNGAFSVSSNNLTINTSPNFEAKSSYTIRVRSTDQGGLFTEQDFCNCRRRYDQQYTTIDYSTAVEPSCCLQQFE